MAPINDDGDGHLAYKLGDIVEHDSQRCEFSLLIRIRNPFYDSILFSQNLGNVGRRYIWQSRQSQRAELVSVLEFTFVHLASPNVNLSCSGTKYWL